MAYILWEYNNLNSFQRLEVKNSTIGQLENLIDIPVELDKFRKQCYFLSGSQEKYIKEALK